MAAAVQVFMAQGLSLANRSGVGFEKYAKHAGPKWLKICSDIADKIEYVKFDFGAGEFFSQLFHLLIKHYYLMEKA